MDYQEYLKSPEWRSKRSWALERAGHRCQVCNCAGELHVHHRTYENLGHEQPGDVLVLCRACHGLYHGKVDVQISPEAIADLIRGTRRVIAMGQSSRFLKDDEPSTEEYIRRAALALSAYPDNLRSIVAGVLLETGLVPAGVVEDLLAGLEVDQVELREQQRVLDAVRMRRDPRSRRTPA